MSMRSIILFLSLAISSIANGQNICITYSNISDEEQLPSFNLIIADTASYWTSCIDTFRTWGNDIFFIKNYNTGLVYYDRNILSQQIFVADSIYPMQWELTNDTATILNQLCYSAKTFFRGRHYIAFYAPGLAGSDGPWKFGGLPGIILSVQSTDGDTDFKAVKIIYNYINTLKPIDMNRHKFLTWNEFTKKYISVYEKIVKQAKSNGIMSEGMSVTFTVSGETEIIYPDLQDEDGITFQ